jgi:hypothetical protein
MTAGAAIERAPKREIMSWSVTAAIVGKGFRGDFKREVEAEKLRYDAWTRREVVGALQSAGARDVLAALRNTARGRESM